MHLLIFSIGHLITTIPASTLPPSNSINLGDVHVLGNHHLSNDSISTTSSSFISNHTFPGQYQSRIKWGTTALCVTALIVNAGDALAIEAVKDHNQPIPSATYTVEGYEEVSIKIITNSDTFIRRLSGTTICQILRHMKDINHFVSFRWTIEDGDEAIARVDFHAHLQPSSACSSDLVGAAASRIPTVRKTATASGLNDDPSFELSDCTSYGEAIDPWGVMVAAVQVLAMDDLGFEGPGRHVLWLVYRVRNFGLSFSVRAINPDVPNLPPWNLYWIAMALGAFPKALIDKDFFDWREMNATVKVGGVTIGYITLQKGVAPGPPRPTGSAQALTLTA